MTILILLYKKNITYSKHNPDSIITNSDFSIVEFSLFRFILSEERLIILSNTSTFRSLQTSPFQYTFSPSHCSRKPQPPIKLTSNQSQPLFEPSFIARSNVWKFLFTSRYTLNVIIFTSPKERFCSFHCLSMAPQKRKTLNSKP